MLPASMKATRLRNMSVNIPAGMFTAPSPPRARR